MSPLGSAKLALILGLVFLVFVLYLIFVSKPA